jgi:hypothetical protein
LQQFSRKLVEKTVADHATLVYDFAVFGKPLSFQLLRLDRRGPGPKPRLPDLPSGHSREQEGKKG